MTSGPTHICKLDLATLPSAASIARLHTADVLRRWRASHVADTAQLLVSELVANAIRHATPPTRQRPTDERCPTCDRPLYPPDHASRAGAERITLTLARVGASLFIEVHDPDPRPPVFRPAGVWDESGRGLLLFSRLATRWNYYHPTPGGKVVWCELPL